jgi:hypothetical protein
MFQLYHKASVYPHEIPRSEALELKVCVSYLERFKETDEFSPFFGSCTRYYIEIAVVGCYGKKKKFLL